MKTIDFSKYAVLSDNGSVDEIATVAKFTQDLIEHTAVESAMRDRISVAVDSIFDENLGKAVKMPNLAGLAAHRLEVATEDFDNVVGLVKDYVRANSKPGGLYNIKKGPGCGVTRTADKLVDESSDEAAE